MGDSADIRSVDVLGDLRRGLAEFVRTSRGSLADVDRALGDVDAWLNATVRQRERALESAGIEVDDARREVHACYSTADDDYTPDCSWAEQALDEARRLRDACSARLDAARQWQTRMERELTNYRRQARRVDDLLRREGEFSNRFTTRKIAEVEAYLRARVR